MVFNIPMVVTVTIPIVMETEVVFCNSDGRNAAIVWHTLVGFVVVLDAALPLSFIM